MMRTLLQLVLWNVGFVACLAVLVANVDQRASELIGLSLPYIVGLWLLLMGALYARRRGFVLAVAIVAGILLALQGGIFGLLALYNRGFRNSERESMFEVFLGIVVATGVILVWWFIAAKRQPKEKAEA